MEGGGVSKLFQIVQLTPEGPVPQVQFGEFEDGKYASDFAKAISIYGRKYQVRPVAKDEDWRERERRRFANFEYTPLSWADRVQLHLDHFAHVDPDTPENVRFTESEEKGKADIKTSLPVNRYLVKYHNYMNPHERKLLKALHIGMEEEADVKFATTADEIERVYLQGPSSCMAHDPDWYAAPHHPVRQYAAGDLAIAYMEDEDGRITYRAICWPEKKIYARIYPDWGYEEFVAALEKLGYVYSWLGFQGASMLAELASGEWAEDEDDTPEYFDGYISPYLDVIGSACVSECGKYLILNKNGEVDCQNQAGIGEVKGSSYKYECVSCGNDRYDVDYYHNSQNICTDCAIRAGRICCVSGRYNPNILLADGRAVDEMYKNTHVITDPKTGLNYLKNEGIPQPQELAA